jgi:proteic killer suppression protein
VIKSFRSKQTQDLHERKKGGPFQTFENVALRELRQIEAALKLDDLAQPPENRLEALKGDRQGQHSIRINDPWRVCFEWKDGNAYNVEIVDYH